MRLTDWVLRSRIKAVCRVSGLSNTISFLLICTFVHRSIYHAAVQRASSARRRGVWNQ